MTKRKLRKFYANDDEFKIIEVYAEQANISFSEYVRKAALSEGKRHLPTKRLDAYIDARVQKAMKVLYPVRVEHSEAIRKQDDV